MKIFVDSEYMDDGRTIELLSLGAVRDDGCEFYAVNSEADHLRANEWVRAHVLPNLYYPDDGAVALGGGVLRHTMARAFREFCGGAPEFWGYFADYDWVVVCQLYGRMIDLPAGWPQFCLDLQQVMYERGVRRRDLPATLVQARGELPEHHALADARWNRAVWRWLRPF